jgi:putative ABC transport system ATP-binding protein
MTDPATLFLAERASHTFGTGSTAVVAVSEVSCTVTSGARVALTGPSGSGKSTLLHMMAGLEQATSGRVSWGTAGGHPAGRPDQVGLIFQGVSLIPSLNAVENVALPLLIGGMSFEDARDRAHAAIGRLHLDGFVSKLPDELSGGQAQRIAVARVLAAAPKLILADEPTGQLDHAAGILVVDLLIDAADELGAALVVSTHDLTIAARFATRWTMHDGRLSAGGSRASEASERTGS